MRIEPTYGGLLSRLHAGAGATADMLFADLGELPPAGAPQLPGNNAYRASDGLPAVFVLANAVLTAIFGVLAASHFAPSPVIVWSTIATMALLLSLATWHRIRKPPVGVEAHGIRLVELSALALGLTWAAVPALFFDTAEEPIRIFGAAFVFAMAGLGTLAFGRVPSAAIFYCGLISGSSALTALKLGGELGVALSVFSLAYGMAATGMVLAAHRRDARQYAAMRELQRQNDFVALLLNDFEQGSSDWLWEADADLRLTYASPRLAEMLGRATADLAGLPLAALAGAGAEETGAWEDLDARLKARETVRSHDLDVQMAGQTVTWRLSARPLSGSDGTFLGYRGVGRDVTVEKRALEDLLQAKEQAELANASKSQFLAVMSHELKTPLNAIVGFSELLASPQADFLSDESRADHLRTILDSSRHLQSLINDILDATRIEKGTMRLVEQEADAAEVVEVAAKMCRDAAERADATIVARIIDSVEIRGDVTRLKQILINLITNAVKFSSPGGYVYVGFERQDSGSLAITIRDSGIGIGPGDIAKVFEPFVQADDGMARRFGGMGLGLSIARKLARLHGGDVTLDSAVGCGTTARLSLPSSRVVWPAGLPAGSATAA